MPEQTSRTARATADAVGSESHRALTGRAAARRAAAEAAEVAAEEALRSERLQHSAWWWLRAAAIAVALFAGWQLLLVVQGWVTGLLTIILFVVFGTVVAFAATPVMRALERWARFPHMLAVLASLLAVLVVVAALIYLIAGPLAAEVSSLIRRGPTLVREAQQRIAQIEQTLNAHGISVGGNGGGGGLDGLLGGKALASHIGAIVVTGVTGVIVVLVDSVIVLITAFWLLKDGAELRRGFVQMLPGRLREDAEFALDATQVVIGGYVRAQLLLAALIGVLAWAGCTGLGVPYPIVVGVAAGVFELVPMLGPFLGGAVGVALALTHSPVLALWTAALFVGIHIIEGYVLAPRIQARFIQLHPLVAFLALIAGIEVDGILGALFAVPLASLAAVFLRASIGDWRANRPEMFQASLQDAYAARRRRVLLHEFRLMQRTPGELFGLYGPAAWLRRFRGGRGSRGA
jgi:predicted PurR-regulated permease PerM